MQPQTKPTTKQEADFAEWALVELLGRQQIAGLVTNVSIAGAGFLRVDVPDQQGETVYTRFYSPAAVYAISPVSKEIAVEMAVARDDHPVTRWDVPKLLASCQSKGALPLIDPDGMELEREQDDEDGEF